jgi:hypothetical protein
MIFSCIETYWVFSEKLINCVCCKFKKQFILQQRLFQFYNLNVELGIVSSRSPKGQICWIAKYINFFMYSENEFKF